MSVSSTAVEHLQVGHRVGSKRDRPRAARPAGSASGRREARHAHRVGARRVAAGRSSAPRWSVGEVGRGPSRPVSARPVPRTRRRPSFSSWIASWLPAPSRRGSGLVSPEGCRAAAGRPRPPGRGLADDARSVARPPPTPSRRRPLPPAGGARAASPECPRADGRCCCGWLSGMTAVTPDTDLFSRHRERLDAAVAACASREYYSAFSESPSPRVYGETAAADGRAAYDAWLDGDFPLSTPGSDGSVAGERSPVRDRPRRPLPAGDGRRRAADRRPGGHARLA